MQKIPSRRTRAMARILIFGLLASSINSAINIVGTPQAAQAAAATSDILFFNTSDTTSARQGLLQVRHGNGSITNVATLADSEPMVNAKPSPDGSRVVFPSVMSGRWYPELYVANSDGSGISEVTTASETDPHVDWYPSWCNSQTVLFERLFPDAPEEIWKVSVGSTITETKISLDDTKHYTSPECSPDGSKIAFSRYDDTTGNSDIWYMNSNGTGETRLANQPPGRYNDGSTWGSSSRIYFQSSGGPISYIYGLNTSGSGGVQVSSPDGYAMNPSVSGDGSKVVYNDLQTDLYSINSNGTGTATQLTNTPDISEVNPAYFKAAWPAAPPTNSTATISAPSPKDAAFTRQVTVGLSATGNSRFDVGWSKSSTTAPNTNYLQTITDMTTKKGSINYLGTYSKTNMTWSGGTQPDQDWYLWVRPVTLAKTARAWATPLKVHTPKRPVWVGVGDSYSSGHHQSADYPWCPDPKDTDFKDYESNVNCPEGDPAVKPNDINFSWVKKAVDTYNTSMHIPNDPVTGWSYGLDLTAFSGAWTSSFGTINTTPGTDAWASGSAQSYSVRKDLYARYDSWNVVSVTGGANDTNWAHELADFYWKHRVLAQPAPWNVSTANPSVDCPNSQSVWTWLKATQLDGRSLDAHIQTNIRGVVTIATRYSPGVRILNVGYPNVLDHSNICAQDSVSGAWHGTESVVNDLNANLMAVTGPNVHYVSLMSEFGISPVSSNYLQLLRVYGYPHPNMNGQARIADAAGNSLRATW